MLKCFFGHKLGKVTEDGYQYCERCGTAIKPYPCTKGHVWRDDATQGYLETRYNGYGQKRENQSRQTFQTCTRCGDKRAIWS